MRRHLPVLTTVATGLILSLLVAPATVEAPTESLEAVVHALALCGGPLLLGWAGAVWLSARSYWPALIMLVLSVPIGAVMAGEIASRLSGNFGRNGWEVYENRDVYGPGASGVWRGVYGVDREYAVPIRKNELGIGFRGPMPGPKGERTRIVFLGDSQTEALQVRLDSTYPRRVQRRCPDVEAINLGESGIGQVEMLGHLRRLGPRLEPDIIIASFLAHNDVSDNLPTLDRTLAEREDFRFSTGPARAFAQRHRLQTVGILLRRLNYEANRWRSRDDTEPHETAEDSPRAGAAQDTLWAEAWARTEAASDSLAAWAMQHDARFGVWIAPGRSHAQGRDKHWATESRMLDYLSSADIPVLPVARTLLELPPEQRRATAYTADSHMTARGHAFVAARMVEWFRRLGWACDEGR